MYYTAVDKPDTYGFGNQIFLARSSNGINWTKYPSNSNPQPVIPNRVETNCYGTGQSSVLYRNGTFWHYFSDNNPIDGTNTCYPDAVYLATSTDGIHWTRGNNSTAVYIPAPGTGAVDVKYSPTLNLFFMAYANIGSPIIYWNASIDGIHWKPHSESRILTRSTVSQQNHNVGIVGTPLGGLVVPGSVIYGSGPVWNPWVSGPAQWQLHRTDINVLTQILNSPTPSPSPTATPTSIPGDFYHDGKINYRDLLVVLAGFRQTYSIFSYGTVVSQYGKVQ